MATNVHRGVLGFEKFFRRKSPTKSVKNANEDGDVSTKNEKDANPSADDSKSATKEIDESSSQKTSESKKSSKKKQTESTPESTTGKDGDKPLEACKDCVIQDGVKLTEIINNSIKEAVLNIVKEGVRPLSESLDLRAKDAAKKLPTSTIQETQDKENKPSSPKHLSSLISGANKTFDSHLCQSHYQQSSQSLSPSSGKFNEHHVAKNRKSSKSIKQKDKSVVRETSTKICRSNNKPQSSHFRTDNRRMTGNVNIYICSEANENTKDKQKNRNKDCVDDSESATSSSLSASTSKLVAALRKKQRKNLDDKSLSCVCEIPKNSAKPYDDKMVDGDDLLCLCNEDGVDDQYPDVQSSLSKDACACDDAKSSDVEFSGSDLDQPCSSSASDGYASYDHEDFWPRPDPDRLSYADSDESRKFDQTNHDDDSPEKNVVKRCSCCNSRRCREDERSSVGVPCPRISKTPAERRKSRDRMSRVSRDNQQFSKCLCVVEEVDEDLSNERKKSEVQFAVCGTSSTKEESGKIDNSTEETGKSALKSNTDLAKGEKTESGSLKSSRKNSARASLVLSTSSQKTLEQRDEANVEDVNVDSKPQSPKPTLLSSWRKNFKRSSGKENRETKKPSPEISEVAGQTKNIETDESPKNSELSKNSNQDVSPVVDDKRRDSFFYRSIRKAMSIVKTRKDEDVASAAVQEGEVTNKVGLDVNPDAEPSNDKEIKKENRSINNCEGCCNELNQQNCNFDSSNSLKQEKTSRSRISTAIASRRSLTATSNASSNVNVSCCHSNRPKAPIESSPINDPLETEDPGRRFLACKCGKPSGSSDCRCQKPEPTKSKTCTCCPNCKTTKSGTSLCSKKLPSSRRESPLVCQKCGNPPEKCVCHCKQNDEIKSDPCECSKCNGPVPECKCCRSGTESSDREFCKCCQRPKRLCCCDKNENPLTDRSPSNKCQPRDHKGNDRECNDCCSPKNDCRCSQTSSNWKCPKSMICMYCDKPQDDCVCKAPVRKCSHCGLPKDVCNCNPPSCCDCNGRQIVPSDDNDRSTMCVTAWKPRRSVRRYFGREQNDGNGNSDEDCSCYEKPYGSDGLPYQKGAVFSDVMNELQHKMSDSVCCNVCGKVPCDCRCGEDEERVGKRSKQRLSSIAEKRSICQSHDRSRSKSPIESCRCGTPRKKSVRKVSAAKICDRCNTSPCRCRRSSASPRKKPSAKCYYCKSSPCTCAPVTESTNSRPFRKSDSSNRRRKNCNSTNERAIADKKNVNNDGHRGRESNHVGPYKESQQPRKYCYRGNSNGQHNSKPGERVR